MNDVPTRPTTFEIVQGVEPFDGGASVAAWEQGRRHGAEKERAAIVWWLRHVAREYDAFDVIESLAQRLEVGQHNAPLVSEKVATPEGK